MNTKVNSQREDKARRQKYMDLFGWLTVVDVKTTAYLWNLQEGVTVFLTKEMAQCVWHCKHSFIQKQFLWSGGQRPNYEIYIIVNEIKWSMGSGCEVHNFLWRLESVLDCEMLKCGKVILV